MQKQQQTAEPQTTIIRFEDLKKFRNLMNIPSRPFELLEYRECFESKPKTSFSAYSSEALIKLLKALQDNAQQFMQILAINTTLSKSNKKQFLVNNILREHCEFSFEDLLTQLHYIRNQLRDQQTYNQMLNFIKLLISKAKYLLYKYCQTLVMVMGDYLNFYVRRKKDLHDNWQYSLVIGLDRICVSFISSNNFLENVLQALVTKLRERCIIDGHSIDDKDFDVSFIQASEGNLFQPQDLPQHFLQMYPKRQTQLEERLLLQPNPQIAHCTLVMNTLVKYAQDIFFAIEGTIVFLTNLVLQKKQLKMITYDQQFISMHHPLDKEKPITQTYMNLYCQHFEGLPQQVYKNGEKCPYCSQPIILDEMKSFDRNRNIFQLLLARNYLNLKGDDVIYYFRDKSFTLATKEKFSSYAHFCQFIKKHYFVRDRPEVLMLLEHEKISLYSKLWGKKKLFSSQELIQTPVRGKYCRHLEFYELMRVYEKYLAKQADETSFECFLCFEQIEFSELIYLHEIKLLIDLARHNFYTHEDCQINTYLQIDHTNEKVDLCWEMEKCYMKKTHLLGIYQTLMDPLTKSPKPEKKGKKDKPKEQEEFEYTEEFSNFYFGY